MLLLNSRNALFSCYNTKMDTVSLQFFSAIVPCLIILCMTLFQVWLQKKNDAVETENENFSGLTARSRLYRLISISAMASALIIGCLCAFIYWQSIIYKLTQLRSQSTDGGGNDYFDYKVTQSDPAPPTKTGIFTLRTPPF